MAWNVAGRKWHCERNSLDLCGLRISRRYCENVECGLGFVTLCSLQAYTALQPGRPQFAWHFKLKYISSYMSMYWFQLYWSSVQLWAFMSMVMKRIIFTCWMLSSCSEHYVVVLSYVEGMFSLFVLYCLMLYKLQLTTTVDSPVRPTAVSVIFMFYFYNLNVPSWSSKNLLLLRLTWMWLYLHVLDKKDVMKSTWYSTLFKTIQFECW